MDGDNNDDVFSFEHIRFELENLPGQMKQVRDDQVVNAVGGYVFRVSDETRIRRFLILGTSSGTYYVNAKQLTYENVHDLIEIIKDGKGGLILKELVDVSLRGRAPKQATTMMALALCVRAGYFKRTDLTGTPLIHYNEYLKLLMDEAVKVLPKVCRIPTHLFEFLRYANMIAKEVVQSHGWGRCLRRAVAHWYLNADPQTLALHMTKYGSREGYSHRDALRLSHPKAAKNDKNALLYDQLFHFATDGKLDFKKGDDDYEPGNKRPRKYTLTPAVKSNAQPDHPVFVFLQNYLELKQIPVEEANVAQVIRLVKENKFVREHIPTDFLNYPEIWKAMLPDMPMTALLRNLSKLSTLKIIDGSNPENNEYVDLVVKKITDETAIHKARIHPLSVLIASGTYNSGRGLKGSLEWEVNPAITAALNSTFLKAFHNVEPTNKRYLLAFDVSGSMTYEKIADTAISARQAAVALGLVTVNTEKNVETVYFDNELKELDFNASWTLEKISEYMDNLRFGSTDCSLPMEWARKNKKAFDVFIIYTDNDTYIGDVHPFEAMQNYRKEMNLPEAKLIVMGMTATEFTIADPTDAGMLDIVGLDSSSPEIIRAFTLGEI